MDIIKEVKKELSANADKKTAESSKKFFKEPVKVYGIKSSVVKAIASKYYKEIKNLDKKQIFNLCEELMKSGYLEEFTIGCNWSYRLNKQYERKDFAIFEAWVFKYITNWAVCDVFCSHTVGCFIMMYPEFVENLKIWAKNRSRWVKRAAAVSLIIPARKGMFLNSVFKISGILLQDGDDLVQKGYGWMLKSASDANQKAVFDYVLKNKSIMPRTSLRYAIEKMPKELKAKLMEK